MGRWVKEVDAAAFEQIYGAFGDFHTYFSPLFGRRGDMGS